MLKKTKILFLAFFVAMAVMLVATGCSLKSTSFNNHDESELPIRRYDLLELRYLTTGDYSALQTMRTTYVVETRALVENLLKLGVVGETGMHEKFRDFYKDTTLVKMLDAVSDKYANMDEENEQLQRCYKRMDDLLPGVEKPEIYTQIGDFEQSVIVSGNLVGVCLDKYLGEDYPTYKRFFDAKQRKQMTREYIIPDCICVYLLSKFPLDDFNHASQELRDFHMQAIWYAANKILGKDFYSQQQTAKVQAFMQVHKRMSLSELLSIQK